MAVTLCAPTNHETFNTAGNQTGDSSVAIPSDCDAILVMACPGYDQDYTLTQLNFDDGVGNDFTTVVHNNVQAGLWSILSYIMLSNDANWPGTGNKTLSWNYSHAINYGGVFCVIYLKGVATSGTVIDTDIADTIMTFTSSLVGVSAGDLSFVMVGDYKNNIIDVSGNGQTVIDSGANDNDTAWGIACEDGEDAIIASSDSTSYCVYLAFSIAAAAAGGISIPVLMVYYKQLRIK